MASKRSTAARSRSATRTLKRAAVAATKRATKGGSRAVAAGSRSPAAAPARKAGAGADRPRATKAGASRTASKSTSDWGGISSAAVAKATGKGWDEWLAVLDADGGADLVHKEIAALLSERHGVPPWWSQMVTVGYEQARGLRKKHETAEGYSVSASRMIAASVERVWAAWEDPKLRKRWLSGITYRVSTATKPKSLRLVWDDATRVEVLFYVKGPAKSLMTVQHRKIATEKDAHGLKSWWGGRVDALRELVTSG